VTSVEIVEYDPGWPQAFRDVGARVRSTLGERATRIDHIGSTAVPGLAAKDIIDVQVSVETVEDLEPTGLALAGAGWILSDVIAGDHDVPGLPPDQRKRFLREPPGDRRVNMHVRVLGHANQRYPLVVRDYLRAHPLSAHAYATLKRDLAQLFPDDSARYADTKDAACDLIYLAAEDWAQSVAWDAGAPDA
jgi:dephospho-CoA kinase